MKQLVLPITPEFSPTLANFVAGRNAELLATLREMAGGAGESFLYLWGEPGSGRSHLLRAFAAATGGRYLAAPWEGLEDIDGTGAVALDDVDALPEPLQIAAFNLCNRVREGGGRLLAAGPCPPPQLAVRADLATRLSWGLVYRVHALSDEEKAEALRAHAGQKGFALPQEVLAYLLSHSRRDLPSLLAVLDALDSLSLELRRPVSVPLAREVLQTQAAQRPRR